MVSPTKMIIRSPLKETDTNLKHKNGIAVSTTTVGHLDIFSNDNNCNNNNATESFPKKRSLERLELQQQQHLHEKKKAKLERARSIEGAVQVSKVTGLKNVEPRVTPKELLEWQTNWKKIMKRDSRIYFDITDDVEMNTYNKSRMDKRRDLLKRGFLTLGAQITQFFDTTVTIVITRRSVENIYLLKDTDILSRAKKNYMKVWSYEKAARFLKNLDVDLDHLSKTKSASLATPTLSNLLHNEKIYGPTDRDPRTKRDDIHYFKYPHVYLYDLWQTWAPIITLEWKPQELTNLEELPYPILKLGSFGRCPFIGDRNYDESSYKRVVKRYSRDKANKKYALQLRALFQYHADTFMTTSSGDDQTKNLIFIPHTCNDSTKSFKKWMQEKAKTFEKNELKKSHDDAIQSIQNENDSQTDEKNTISLKEVETRKHLLQEEEGNKQPIVEQSKNYTSQNVLPAAPKLSHPILATFTRQETEEVPDDLCTLKAKSRQAFEIKASGAHQSNDVATSFGNGLGPTRASVMSKNMKSLSRLMVDRKLGVKQTNGNSKTAATTTAAEIAKENKHISDGIVLKKDEPRSKMTGNNNSIHMETNSKLPDFSNTTSKSASTNSKLNNDIKIITKDSITALKKTTTYTNISLHPNAPTTQPVKKETVKNSGYCENCRVKYESLEQHIVSEKHLSFADNNLNFEAIDSLIENLRFQI